MHIICTEWINATCTKCTSTKYIESNNVTFALCKVTCIKRSTHKYIEGNNVSGTQCIDIYYMQCTECSGTTMYWVEQCKVGKTSGAVVGAASPSTSSVRRGLQLMITIEHDDFPSQNGELENIASLYKILENVSFKSLSIFIFVGAASPSTSSVRRGPPSIDDHD